MKITEDTTQRLKIKQGTFAMGCLTLFSLPFLISGIAVIVGFGKVNTVRCDRVEPTQINCQLTSSGLLGETQKRVFHLRGADIENNDDTYRVVLLADQKLPLTDYYTSDYLAKQTQVRKIQTFINDPNQTLFTVSDDGRWFAYSFGGIFTLVGLGLFVGSLTTKINNCLVFDKSTNNLTIQNRSLLGQSTTTIYPLRAISSVEIHEVKDSDGDLNYRLKIRLRTGENLPDLLYTSTRKDIQKIATKIQKFLGLRSIK